MRTDCGPVLSRTMFLGARYGDSLYDFSNFDRAPKATLNLDTPTQERFGGTATASLTQHSAAFARSELLDSGWERRRISRI